MVEKTKREILQEEIIRIEYYLNLLYKNSEEMKREQELRSKQEIAKNVITIEE